MKFELLKKERKESKFQVWMSDEMKKRLEIASKKLGVSKSDIIRAAIDRVLKQEGL